MTRTQPPKYRLHKASGQAVVTLSGRDIYLGQHGTDQSRAEYDRGIAEWLANGRTLLPNNQDDALTVIELAAAFWTCCEQEYEPQSLHDVRAALRQLRRLYGHTRVADFGPRSLETIMNEFVREGLARSTVNKYASKVKKCFRWGVRQGLVPADVYHALTAVEGLRRGRTAAPEPEPVTAVSDEIVERTLPHLSRTVADMVRVQRLTGMRPGEVCAMTTDAIDTSGEVWLFAPRNHKTAHHGKDRTVPIRPRCQRLLEPYLRTDLTAPIFSPHDAEAERKAMLRRERKTPMTPSQRTRDELNTRAAPSRGRAPRDRYSTQSYGRAIRRACERAGVPHWSPNQLRHARATEIRRMHGLDAAGAVLGHSKLDTTEVYAERDLDLATRVAQQSG